MSTYIPTYRCKYHQCLHMHHKLQQDIQHSHAQQHALEQSCTQQQQTTTIINEQNNNKHNNNKHHHNNISEVEFGQR